MTTYTGTQIVDPGLYFALRPLSLTSVDQKGPLPGADTRQYRQVPMLLMLGLAPLLGLAFVIFLPLIGFLMVFRLLGDRAVDAGARVGTQAARVMRPVWEPAVAFLTRGKPARRNAPPAAQDPWVERVERTLRDDNRLER